MNGIYVGIRYAALAELNGIFLGNEDLEKQFVAEALADFMGEFAKKNG